MDRAPQNIIAYRNSSTAPKNAKLTIAMEYAAGGDLGSRIDKHLRAGTRFAESEVRKILAQCVDALAYCHTELHLLHRDLKPENILYANAAPDETIKIADFGLARSLAAKGDMMKTACGTPGYVAPEILANKGYDKTAVDMWSVGVILYILLCGFPPFYEEELPALFDQILKGRYDFPSPWWDNISDSAKQLVRAMLTVDPKKRITAEEALHHPWICGNAPNVAIDTDNLKKLQATRKLRKAANKLMAINRMKLAMAAK